VVERAKSAGVEGVVVVAEFVGDQNRVLEIAKKYPNFCFASLGVHPIQEGNCSVTEEHFKKVESLIRASANEICGIGEVGLDFSPRFLSGGDEDKKRQREVFRRQIQLANELNIPVNVHSRSAGRPVVDWLLEHKANSALLHAYSGNPKSAKPAIQAGYYFSIPPSFSLNSEREGLVKAIPIEQICLETDSPVLGPTRDERNEPANVRVSAEFIARIKGMPVSDVIKITTQNARKLFNLL